MKFIYQLKVSLWIWLVAAMALILLLTSCNPYGSTTPTAAAAVSTETVMPKVKPAPLPTPSRVPRMCTVRTGFPSGALNIRTGAGVNHSVIQTLTEGQQLTLTNEAPRGHWIKVTTDQLVTGWINSRYCTIGE